MIDLLIRGCSRLGETCRFIRGHRLWTSTGLATALLILSMATPAHPRTWVVAHSGGDADSLSTACRLAASGDTIQIEAGRYVADHGFPPKPFILERNKALTILGPDAARPQVTLVSHRMFLADCPGLIIRSVRFEDGESAHEAVTTALEFNPDYMISHFATCPQSDKHRR